MQQHKKKRAKSHHNQEQTEEHPTTTTTITQSTALNLPQHRKNSNRLSWLYLIRGWYNDNLLVALPFSLSSPTQGWLGSCPFCGWAMSMQHHFVVLTGIRNNRNVILPWTLLPWTNRQRHRPTHLERVPQPHVRHLVDWHMGELWQLLLWLLLSCHW